ncbi:MAG: hypothetical protein PHU71_03165 [Candidatus Gracilibacteria bacterium]|nr:hypothetical protein [Candidatus Gracilibacteria bacterium]
MKKILAVSLLAVLVLAGCGYTAPKLNSEGGEVVEDEMYVPTEEDVKKFHESNQDTLCTSEPFVSAIGRDIYPVSDKYSGLKFLGQIFTAADCNQERLQEVFPPNYYSGIRVVLEKDPSTELIKTFKDAEFSCYEDVSDISCKQWYINVDYQQYKQSKNQIIEGDLEKVLSLKPYSNEFLRDDCVNCG